jgi:hypothetical protein
LSRLDLMTGEIEDWFSGVSFSFSSDERYFVHTDRDENLIYIRDLLLENQKAIALPKVFEDVGLFEWSPDVTKLFFVAGLDGWWEGNEGFSLFVYDIEKNKLTELSQDNKHYLAPPFSGDVEDPWLDDTHLILQERYGEYGFAVSNFWLLDIDTGELVPYKFSVE